jgi:glycerophosphoryl diester phosphodiesterase
MHSAKAVAIIFVWFSCVIGFDSPLIPQYLKPVPLAFLCRMDHPLPCRRHSMNGCLLAMFLLVGIAEMKPLYVKVILYDPATDTAEDWAGFPIFDGIEVQIANVDPGEPEDAEDILTLIPDPARRIFFTSNRRYLAGSHHYLRVSFEKRNFSKTTKALYHPNEIQAHMLPVYCPARIPVWDSGWDDGYRTNEFFGEEGVNVVSTPDSPLLLRVPMRRIYNIGHRGAPYHFPENTIASFRKALDLGANGLEFDLCLTKDRRIIVYHDASPDSSRILFEDFPYELVSPEIDGDVALIKELKDGEYRIARRRRMWSGHSFDILKLDLDQVKHWYRYHHVEGAEYPIPDLEDFLAYVSGEVQRLKLLFFDVKNPFWDEDDRKRYEVYGATLGALLRRYPNLPERLVIANSSRKILESLKVGLRQSGEERCEFAFDAAGSFGAMFGFKKNPLAVARDMGNTIVSIGTRFRSGDMEEIIEATRDRDYNRESKLTTVLHWTINDPAHLYHSVIAGVNGIVTDKPDVLSAVLSRLDLYVG